MDATEIRTILSSPSPKEPAQTTTLRERAHDLISSTTTLEALPSTLLDLLTQIIKPLFTGTKHPSLTSTGRKNLFPNQPSLGTRFLTPLDDADLKPWKTPFTAPLLTYILRSYATLTPSVQKPTIETHFHLLVPPILNMIDDADNAYKSHGCRLLGLLCNNLASVHSEMLKRTGLTDVFADALRTNFLLLPTLTPEEESLRVLRELYPAYLALVDARFGTFAAMTSSANVSAAEPGATWGVGEDFVRYQAMLATVYRHGIVASLTHLSSGASISSTVSVSLTALLLAQIPPVFHRMGVHAVRVFQTLLPMLRGALMDPFVLGAPEVVLAVLDVLQVVVRVGAVRVREKWWAEVLRGVVGCWCNVVDEREGPGAKNRGLDEVVVRMKGVVRMLGEVMDTAEWERVKERLVDEEGDLKGLFED